MSDRFCLMRVCSDKKAAPIQPISTFKRFLRPGWRYLRRTLIKIRERQGDQRLGINTRIPRIDWSKSDFKVEQVPYDPVPYMALSEIDRLVGVSSEDVIYELGCGMGRAVCHYAEKPVRKVVGVEFDGDLADVARANSLRLRGKRAAIEIIEGDAADVNLADATVIFMFNPFGAQTMEKVISNLLGVASAGTRIIYINPVHEDVLRQYAHLREVTRFKVRYDLGHAPVVVWTTN